jgi:hypothetical protein
MGKGDTTARRNGIRFLGREPTHGDTVMSLGLPDSA